MPQDAYGSMSLVVFCRRPSPGIGKRRLAGELGESVTLTLSELLLATALEDLADWPGLKVLAPSATPDVHWARGLPVAADDVIAQPEGNLGVRLAGVDRVLRERGHTHILFIGSDAPVLGPADYLGARLALTAFDVVLGPALDGGVTCMGSRHAWPDLTHLPWSASGLHTALQSACEGAGRTVQNLALRYDVDVPADLLRLCTDLAADARPARRVLYRTLCTLGYCRS
jgi:glycosyltransferase A (GT-A) superfamily protein (DUF2064 family)